MDIKELRYFVSIVEMGSLSKAAASLGMSQPSLSQRMVAMEYDLGVPLLLRSQTGVRPTEAGLKLYRHARVVISQMQALEAEVSDQSGGASGNVAVGLPTSVATVIAAPLITRLRQDHPGVRLTLFESFSGYLGELLANGRLDLAVLFRKTDTPGLKVRHLFTDYLWVFGGPSGEGSCDVAELDGVPMVLPGPTNGLRSTIEKMFDQANARLNVIADVDSLPAMMELARSGVAATINSAAIGTAYGAGLTGRRITAPTIERPICLCRPTGLPQNAASLATEETIRTLMRESAGAWDLVPTTKVGPARPPPTAMLER